MATNEQKKIVAWQICNTIGVVDNYPSIYQAAYEIHYKGRITKKTAASIKGLQSEDVKKLGYAPEMLLTQLKSIIE